MSDRIVTHPANDAYRNGYDAIFGKKECTQEQVGCGCYRAVVDFERMDQQ